MNINNKKCTAVAISNFSENDDITEVLTRFVSNQKVNYNDVYECLAISAKYNETKGFRKWLIKKLLK